MKEVGPNDARPDYKEEDVAYLVCPGCHEAVHVTEFGSGGRPLPDEENADIGDCVAAHFDVFHHTRYRLIRWLSFGWLP